MDYPSSYDDILKFIVYKCREEKKPVADALIAYILKLQFDNEDDIFYFQRDHTLSEMKIKKIIDTTTNLIDSKKNGILETLKLQVTYELGHISEEEKVEKIKIFFDSEINNIIKDITSFKNTFKKDYDSIQIYKKIFAFLLIKTRQNTLSSLSEFNKEKNLGVAIEREIYAILDNVLPKSGLPPFVSLSSGDKIAQLNDLSNIILGIRLLNGEIGKGGLGLLSLSELRHRLNNGLLESVKAYYNKLNDSCEKYSLIYENIDFNIVTEEAELKVADKIRRIMIYFRQALTYLSMLMDDLYAGSVQVDNLSIDYDKEIKFLIEIVEKKSAISKEQAYPRFENLAKLYIKFQEQAYILDIRANVFNLLVDFLSNGEISDEYSESYFEGKLYEYVDNLDIYSKREEQNFSFEEGIYHNGVSLMVPHSTADFLDIKLEFQGFCIVTLVKKNGLLVNGKPNVISKYKDKYMVFSTPGCVQEFIDNPIFYLEEVEKYVKMNTHLINLLNMTDQFPSANLSLLFRDQELNSYKYKSSRVSIDKEIQTVTHIYENGFIDPNYVWNEWELKKQALQLADILKKKTVSCQTILSHFRRENESQVYLPKDQGVNTTVSKATNLSVPKSYIVGLRQNDNNY